MRLRPRRVEDGFAVPVQVQILESDMVPLLDIDAWPGMPAGHRIRSGIEINRIGRRVAYWMHREHPGERVTTPGHSDLVRVPAEFVRHVYEPLRPGQMRGVSDFAPILAKLRGVMDFDDAVLERQKLANLFTLFVTRPALDDADIDPLTGQSISQRDYDGAAMAGMEPGTSHELLPGEDVRFSTPPDAGANYGEFMRQQHLGVAAGQGTPYELLTGDLKDVSDRTLRVIINEFRRHCEQRQWQIIIPMFCQPVRDAWADAAALAGQITVAEAAEAKRVAWQPQGWAYIHPVQDAEGKKVEVEAGFRSRSSVIAERGNDPDEVDAERAEDAAREKGLGLLIEPAPAKRQETEAATDRGLRDIRASVESLRAEAIRRPADPAAPSVTVNFGETHIAPPAVHNTFHLPEPHIAFEATVEAAAAPNVTVQNVVEPTPVEIRNEVQAAPIADINILSMPTRETTTEINRDVANNITTTRQTESDVASAEGGEK
jgi:lambda family phage portal protein